MNSDSLIVFEEHGPVVVGKVQTASVLDARNVSNLGRELLSFAERVPAAQILLDFSQVTYLSSAVLNELLKVHRKLLETNGSLRLASLNQDIRKVFEITNLDKVFVIYESCSDGIRKFQRSLEIEAQDRAWKIDDNGDT